MTSCILRNQLVRIPGIDDQLFTVEVGSGMGMMLSGDISDAALYWMAEKSFALDVQVQEKYSIYKYLRYKVDILLIIGGSSQSRREFFEEFKIRSNSFKIKIDEISSTSVEMLDITLFKGPRFASTGILDHDCL